jgi:hypothetical protein
VTNAHENGGVDTNRPSDGHEDPKQQPITHPLTATEAKEFVAKEVNNRLWSYIKRFSVVAGIANLVGLAGLFALVYNTARDEAASEAKSEARHISGNADERFQSLLIDYGTLVDAKKNLEKELNRTADDLDKFKNTDPTKVSQVVSSLNEAGGAVLTKLDAILKQEIYEYGVTAFLETIFFATGNPGEFEAIDYPNGQTHT